MLNYPISSFNKDKKLVEHNIRLALGSLNLIEHFFDYLYSDIEDFGACSAYCREIRVYYNRLLSIVESLEYSDLIKFRISSEKSD